MANRKLQGEIDRVLKKVDEGVGVFEQIWDKVYSATTTTQKEKYEGDLKKEIKKLQRLRDQIKTWQGDSSIKDKSKLDSNRKLIEEKMEKFKICEKETKTKAFSKEGLAQDRTDPKQKAKAAVGTWVQNRIATLKEQSDEMEAEIESLNSGKRKKRSEENPRIAELKEQISRHEYHVEMLERVLRAVYNDGVTPEEASDLKESVDYYIECHEDPDFFEDEEMYDCLNLDSLPIPTATTTKKTQKNSERDDAENSSSNGNHIASKEKKGPSSPRNTRGRLSAATSTTSKTTSAITPAARNSVSPKNNRGGERSPTNSNAQSPRASATVVVGRDTNGHRNPNAPLLSSVVKGAAAAAPTAAKTTPGINGVPTDANQIHHTTLTLRPATDSVEHPHPNAQNLTPQQGTEEVDTVSLRDAASQHTDDSERERTAVSTSTQQDVQATKLNVKLSAMDPTLAAVESAIMFMPVAPSVAPRQNPSTRNLGSGTAAPAAASPRNPVATPPSFPSVPAPVFDSREVFEQFDPDTLFFIFYYQQGTYQQYLAATELKRQGWRFHKKYLTWFQRHDEPRLSTDEFETGTFIYFDYANVVVRGQGSGWCQRIKSEFVFEYRFLEDELV